MAKTKLTEEFIKRSYEWIRENGLQDYGGASFKDYCKAMNIDNKSYYNWLKGGYELSSEYSESIKKAIEEFKKNLTIDIVQSLARSAKGYTTTKKTTEYKPDKNGKPTIVKQTMTEYHVPPNVEAGKFLLTNLDPANWKNRQDVASKEEKTIKVDGDAEILDAIPDDMIIQLADTLQDALAKKRIEQKQKQLGYKYDADAVELYE
jgi:hypothetical protein